MLVTPGIRPAGADAGGQKRVITLAKAIAAVADYLVVGPSWKRSIRWAAAETVVAEIAAAAKN